MTKVVAYHSLRIIFSFINNTIFLKKNLNVKKLVEKNSRLEVYNKVNFLFFKEEFVEFH